MDLQEKTEAHEENSILQERQKLQLQAKELQGIKNRYFFVWMTERL